MGTTSIRKMIKNDKETYSLDDLNMRYIMAENNEQFSVGAILHCSHIWDINTLRSWLPRYDDTMLTYVRKHLASDCYIAEGMFLKVWTD